jgi:hypothetical protein
MSGLLTQDGVLVPFSDVDFTSMLDLYAEVTDYTGRLKAVPSSVYARYSQTTISLTASEHGWHSLPTTELVEYLAERIKGKAAVEICAGHAALAKALRIPAVDSFAEDTLFWAKAMQDKREQVNAQIKAHLLNGHKPYDYKYTRKQEAVSYVRSKKPDVVIACWATHKYNANDHHRGGFIHGVDENELLKHCGEYIFVGNMAIHGHKPILELPHDIETPPWLYSRSSAAGANFIATWRGQRNEKI